MKSLEPQDPLIPHLYLSTIEPQESFPMYVINHKDEGTPETIYNNYRNYEREYTKRLAPLFFDYAKYFQCFRETLGAMDKQKMEEATDSISKQRALYLCKAIEKNQCSFLKTKYKYSAPATEETNASTEETDINYYSLLKTFVCIDAMDPYFSRTDFLAVLNEKPELKENFDYMTYGESFSYKPKNLCRPLYLFYKKAVNTNEVKSRLNEVTMKFSNEYFNEAFKESKNVNYEDRRYRLVSTGNTYKVDSMLLPKEANRPLRVQKDLQTAKQLIELLDHAKGISNSFLMMVDQLKCGETPISDIDKLDYYLFYLRNVYNIEYYQGKQYQELGCLLHCTGNGFRRSQATVLETDPVDEEWNAKTDAAIQQLFEYVKAHCSEEYKQRLQQQAQEEVELIAKILIEKEPIEDKTGLMEKQKKCDYCEKSFSSYLFYTKHLINKHFNTSPKVPEAFIEAFTRLYKDSYIQSPTKTLPFITSKQNQDSNYVYSSNKYENYNNYSNQRNNNKVNYFNTRQSIPQPQVIEYNF